MNYNNLGKAGIKVSELSFGSWITFGKNLDQLGVRKLMHEAYSHGVNFFDNAEVYSKGKSEELMGVVIKDFRREDLVISTKLFWGGDGPNDTGLSRKHLLEGMRNSLKRLQLDYVDLIYCHRPDPNTPIEETVRAMDFIVRSGQALYWGTSEWSTQQLEDAQTIAKECGCIPPSMEQPQYNMFSREHFEQELTPLLQKYGLGTTTWSPLNSGILSGKYINGIPKGSRLEANQWLQRELTPEKTKKVKELSAIAKELGCSLPQLAIAWCLLNPLVSSVILGATSVEQLQENLKALGAKQTLTGDVQEAINKII